MHSPDHNETALSLYLPSAAATDALGADLAACVTGGLVIWLEGELGTGKTALVRAALRALGHAGPVKSPTYALLELYEVSSLYCYHFDFYRFSEPREFQDAGLDEYFDGTAVCFVEWPEKAVGYVPSADLRIRLAHDEANAGRKVAVSAHSRKGAECLGCLKSRRNTTTPGGEG